MSAEPQSPVALTQDEEHLKLLSTFHYVLSGVAGFFSFFPIIHLVMGLFFIFAPETVAGRGQPPPAFFGWLFVVVAGTVMVMGWVFAALVLTNGRFLARRKHHQFCVAMAGVECIFMPFGTVLGVFTIIVLMRPSVKHLFSASETAST